MSTVLSMVDYASCPVTDFRTWGHEWIDAIADQHFGEVKSLVICVESKDGRMHRVSQSTGLNDSARLIGLLHILIDGIGRD